jgi:DNA repair exonuclease SbcCD nuclease subunit
VNPFRFIHAADLHLGSPFKGLSGAPEHVRRGLAEAEYGALRRLTEAALEHGADFVVIAGDLFDSADRSLRAQAALHRSWSRLASAGVQVFAIHGNHDPLGLERARFDLPKSVHIFGAGRDAEHRPAYRRDGKPAAFVYGISYDRRAVAENLVPGYRPAAGADCHIALLHANVDGDPNHDAYAPCRLSELLGAGFHYWALGHIHSRRVLHEYPHVVYPGNLQGRHAGETGPKGCFLVDVDASGGMRLTFLPLDEVRWLACRASIEGIADEERLLERMEEAVRGVAASAGGRSVMLEMVLEGRGPLHRRLEVRGSDELLAALRERLGEWTAGDMGPVAYGEPAGQGGMVLRGGYGGADGHGWVWVHRLTVRTAPELELDRLAGEDSFAGEAVRLARRLAADPEGREALLKEALEPMMRNPRLRRLLENRVPVSAEILLERAAARLAGLLEREEA